MVGIHIIIDLREYKMDDGVIIDYFALSATTPSTSTMKTTTLPTISVQH